MRFHYPPRFLLPSGASYQQDRRSLYIIIVEKLWRKPVMSVEIYSEGRIERYYTLISTGVYVKVPDISMLVIPVPLPALI